jgi:molecular chaperone GrpE
MALAKKNYQAEQEAVKEPEMVAEEMKDEALPAEEPVEQAEPAQEQPDLLAELETKVQELEDRAVRQLAEFDNFRKRTTKEKEEIGLVAKVKCISELLPVLDNFERAMQAETSDEEFKKGMALIFQNMWETFQKLGVEEIEAQGMPFNPDFHYAVSTVEDESLNSNTVANVLQKGYRIGDRVVRHAMVAVANP